MAIKYTSRIAKPACYLMMAEAISMRGTCARRRVGCILTDSLGKILSTGYNGTPQGMPHCIDTPCKGADLPSGTGLDLCESIHAEANALLQCPNVGIIHVAYVTASPCIHCVKLLLNTGCCKIIFLEDYPHTEAKDLWERSHGPKSWIQYHKSWKIKF
jgi:dCMP deaminase